MLMKNSEQVRNLNSVAQLTVESVYGANIQYQYQDCIFTFQKHFIIFRENHLHSDLKCLKDIYIDIHQGITKHVLCKLSSNYLLIIRRDTPNHSGTSLAIASEGKFTAEICILTSVYLVHQKVRKYIQDCIKQFAQITGNEQQLLRINCTQDISIFRYCISLCGQI